MVRDGRLVDIVAGPFGCATAWVASDERGCDVMLTPAVEHDVCLTHRRAAIVPSLPRGDAHDPADLAAWFRALSFAWVVRGSSLDVARVVRLARYGVHSAFGAHFGEVIDEAIAAGMTPNDYGMRSLMRKAGSHVLID